MLIPSNVKFYIHHKPTDMRKAINGLSQLVVENFNANPQSGDLFIFYGKSYDKVKILYWHYNGFVLFYKRLDRNKFKIPKDISDNISIDEQQLYRLIEGLHILNKPEKTYTIYS